MDRILLVTATLGKWGEMNGVVNTYIHLIQQFKKRNIALDVITYGPKDDVEKDGSITITTRRPRIPVEIDADLIIDADVSLLSLSNEISKTNYSIVHSATPDLLGWLAYLIANDCNCPLVTAFHTSLSQYTKIRTKDLFGSYVDKISAEMNKWFGWIHGFSSLSEFSDVFTKEIIGSTTGEIAGGVMTQWLQRYFNRADLILAPSNYTKMELMKLFKPPIEVLSRGVDIDKFNPSHRTRPHDPNLSKPDAIYVGRVAPEKNLRLLVKIFKDRQDIHLTVVGEGPYLEEMKEKLPSAEYTGKLSGEQLCSAYANSDFFVFPSRTDTFGNVVLEAMSSGLPVVVTDAMAPKEQVDQGISGFIAETEEDFEKAIVTLAEDAQLRRKMGPAARAHAEERSWDAVFDTLLQQYELARKFYQS